MSGLQIVTEPAREPITAIEAREHLRLDDDVDNVQVMAYVMAARQWAENYTGKVFITRTMRQYFDSTPPLVNFLNEGTFTAHQNLYQRDSIELSVGPLISVDSVKYYDDADAESTWADSNYFVDTVSDVPQIVLRDGGNFPTDLRAANGLEVNFTAGYGSSPSHVPEPIRTAMLQYMTFLYEHRGDFERFPPPSPPSVIHSLLQPYKTMRFSTSAQSTVLRSGIS